MPVPDPEPDRATVEDGPAPPDAPPPGVHLRIDTVAKLNLADFQNAVPALRELAIVNDTDERLDHLSLSLSSEPAFVQPRTWKLESVGPQSTYHLRDLDVRLDGALLSRLTEAEPATWSFALERTAEPAAPTELLARQEPMVELLPRNQWGGIGQMPEMVAAFVQPNDPAVDRLLKLAAQALVAAGKPGAIEGYRQGPKRAWELASGIWSAVLQRRLTYALPPASFEQRGQKVRSPSQVMDGGIATCLDLALLFAACLEQGHLHPLLVFTKGHAFVGLWLQPEEFSSPVVDDVTALRNRERLQELLVFEATLAAQDRPVSFRQAIEQGKRQLAESVDDQFELAVDVKPARMSRIRPLAQAHAAAPEEASPEADPLAAAMAIEEAPDLVSGVQAADAQSLDPKDRLARWQRKLLDLSLRNPLLNFKPGKKALPLDASAVALEDALSEGHSLKLLPRPELMHGRDPRSQALHEARSLEDLWRAHAADALQRREVFIAVPQEELETRLVELYRGARLAHQEGGANTLFLALGFLSWSRADKPDARIRAPLVLLPVTLQRKSARSGFTLLAHEDEPLLNPTLVEMLRQDFQLDLGLPEGELPRDESGLDIAGIWQRVRLAIKDARGWEVSEDVVLSMFSFAKYLMWKDLTDRTDDLRQSPVVAHLIDTPREPYRSEVAFPDVRRLDQEFAPQQVFNPLPADSSQLAAVLAAAKGKDFVLIGPPGTGKSQTIANLIAQCLAENKRVLFVAEKIAALDVVYRRLREVGLGEFCLELHSSKARKLDVLSQLQAAWASRGEVDAAAWAAKADQLKRLRDQLTGYVERLHRRHRNGWSVHAAIGRVAAGGDVRELAFSWDGPDAHGEGEMAALRELAGRIKATAEALGTAGLRDPGLASVHSTEWSMRWQQHMVFTAQQLFAAAQGFQAAAERLGQLLGQPLGRPEGLRWPPLQRNARAALGLLAKLLPHGAALDLRFAAMPDAEAVAAALKAGLQRLQAHRGCSDRLSMPWPAEVRTMVERALSLLQQRQSLMAELGSPFPAAVREEIHRGVALLDQVHHLRGGLSVRYGAGVEALNVALLQRDWARAGQSVWPLSWMRRRQVRATLDPVIESADEPRIADDLAALVRIRSLCEEANQLNPGSQAEGVWAGLRTRCDNARSALAVDAALQAARLGQPFKLQGLEAAAQGLCGERWARDAQRLQALAELDQQIAACAPLSEATQGLWQGRDTDQTALRAALAFERDRLPLQSRGVLQRAHAEVAEGRCGPVFQQQHQLLLERAGIEAEIEGLAGLADRCPGTWDGLDTQPDRVHHALKFQASLQAVLQRLHPLQGELSAALQHALGDARAMLAPEAPVGRACEALLARLADLQAAGEAFCIAAAQPPEVRDAFANATPEQLSQAAAAVVGRQSSLRAWCAWQGARADAQEAGLGLLAEAVASEQLEPQLAVEAFEVNHARWWLGLAVDADPVLRRFVSAEHENRIEAFRALDTEYTALTRQWIRAQLCRDLPTFDSPHRDSEWGVLRREITKRRQHLPLRQLLQAIPSAVLRLTPCLLMSPLSIAQYLSADARNFDLVVFDEASQIPVWDAIGAMARGRQVVMVGDPKQLPPTRFFERGDATEADADDLDTDLESILDECLGASLPTRHLSWHYRSRHESLIAFSNQHYYGGGLVTFPSPVTEDRAVSFHFVQGRYEKGGARINQPEARALVDDLVGRLRSPEFRSSGLTIGVVTFNAEQQGLIEDLLDEARRQDPGLEPFFSDMELEPVFVKNLESVQGDERDIMYFSITYGPDASGAISMNFGPLNREGGERRLNVAVTRARHGLRVFSSLRGDQIELSRTRAHGVRDLKHFLEFAERGPRALAEAHRGSVGDFESPFEASVAAALGRKGWRVHAQIGASSFRIDLGIVHPDHPGRYLAGVECDGATYHRCATARDRDKLREQVLRGLGWEILRIWSTDWWVDAGSTLERIHGRLSALLERERARDREGQAPEAAPQAVSAQLPVADEGLRVDEVPKTLTLPAEQTALWTEAGASPGGPGPSPLAIPAREAAYARRPNAEGLAANPNMNGDSRPRYTACDPTADLPPGAVAADQFHDPRYDPVLVQMVERVVAQEGPILDAVLARRIARAHGFQRTGSRIQERIERIARRRCAMTEESAGTFYWPARTQPGSQTPFRWPSDEEGTRAVEEICEPELASLARWVLGQGKTGEAATLAMARELGLMKLRASSRARLEAVLAVVTAGS